MTTDTTAPTAASNPNDAAQDASRQGPGRLIRLARERSRIGISEMAALTKLATATLEALERDDFTVLREPVYVRGYYRKCAKALAISEQELLSAYEKVVTPRAPQAPTKLLLGGSATGSSLKKTRRRSGSPWLMWLIGFGVLVAVGAWFLREDPNGRHPGMAEAPAAAKPVPVQPAADAHTIQSAPADLGAAKPLSTNELATTPAESGQAASASAEPAAQPAASAPAPTPAPTPVQPTLSTELSALPSAAATPAAAGALTLGFKATSWVRVEDSTGKVLLSGVVQSGDHQVLAGKAPYSLFLGNAPGVSVEYQGQPVDITSYIKSNDTARLSVPVSGN